MEILVTYNNDGTATLSVPAAPGGSTFLWNTGETTSTITTTVPTNYTCEVTPP